VLWLPSAILFGSIFNVRLYLLFADRRRPTDNRQLFLFSFFTYNL
jgi:hypothetical protein